jgi:hypothetical protein
MNRAALFVGMALLAMMPVEARSQISLAWDDCRLDGGKTFIQWACDSNSTEPVASLVVSFRLENSLAGLLGVEGWIEVYPSWTPSYAMPDWWASSCRAQAFSLSADSSTFAHVSCQPAVATPLRGFLSVEDLGSYGRIGFAVATQADPGTVSLDADQEYIAAVVRFDGSGSHGPAACAGCATPICLFLMSLSVAAGADYVSFDRVSSQDQVVGWQCARGTAGSFSSGVPFLAGCSVDGSPCLTSARNRTWGQLKSLYR